MRMYSVWYNRDGIDEMENVVVEGYGFIKEVFKELCDKVSYLEEEMFDEFEVEESGDNWVMYCFDGIGVFEVYDGYDIEECKWEYDEVCS